ncbi:hypothetical protein GWI33_006064 [Rhynchophorus ferrugineus]|uniref:Uncharacterized protein n=1 Tax=Rhynchophorus ferrugineus TaxID=354439 RepID=A0A834MDC6_RHYFE|nr:hypothetical protein GWI33_006064 [Rhynchophorus ferrugineus]
MRVNGGRDASTTEIQLFYCYRGILLQGKHELDEAIQSYKRAINFRPSLALAYVNLGTALIAAGRCQEAITVLRQGSKLDGSGLRDRREHDTAKISALLQLGALYSDQGRLQRALAAYREAAHNLPEHYPPQKVYNVLGETLAKMQQDEEAEKWYRAALDAEPDHVAAHITYGKLLAKNMSRSAEAEQWFRKAQRLAPEDASVYHHYGEPHVPRAICQRYPKSANHNPYGLIYIRRLPCFLCRDRSLSRTSSNRIHVNRGRGIPQRNDYKSIFLIDGDDGGGDEGGGRSPTKSITKSGTQPGRETLYY